MSQFNVLDLMNQISKNIFYRNLLNYLDFGENDIYGSHMGSLSMNAGLDMMKPILSHNMKNYNQALPMNDEQFELTKNYMLLVLLLNAENEMLEDLQKDLDHMDDQKYFALHNQIMDDINLYCKITLILDEHAFENVFLQEKSIEEHLEKNLSKMMDKIRNYLNVSDDKSELIVPRIANNIDQMDFLIHFNFEPDLNIFREDLLNNLDDLMVNIK